MDSQFLFIYGKHNKALARLTFAQVEKGPIVKRLILEAGTGFRCFLCRFTDELQRRELKS